MATNIPYLEVLKLTKRIGDRTLFENISFTVGEKEHIGLIAKNGTGKSTLLSIIAGVEGYEGGDVIFRRDLKVGYLEQSPSYPGDLSVIEACFWHGSEVTELIRRYEQCMAAGGTGDGFEEILSEMDRLKAWDYESKVKQILSQLKIRDFDQKTSQLSGGQIKRVALANVLISEPDMLILDEPTNHLDLEMIEWLENYLSRTTMSLLMVTHDRYFLDRICSSIIEMDDSRIYTYKGNYSLYLDKRQERIDNLSQEIQRANNLYRTELEWMRRMPQARGHKAKYRENAFYELEKVAKRRIDNSSVQLKMDSTYIGSKIFEATNVCKSFGDKIILDKFDYVFSRYEKMGVVGNNGTGKSTFIKMLLGLEAYDSGSIDVGETVRFGYYSQNGMCFDDGKKVIDAVREIAEYVDMGKDERLTASQFLQHFLFPPETQYNYISKLSGGERRRLYLCTVLMRSPNFLILDEPTNDLDIVTLQILEEYLRNFRGCLIVVSHDRYFMDKVVDHLLVFRGGGDIRDFPGNYTQYREWKTLADKKEAENKPDKSKPAELSEGQRRDGTERKRRLTFKERKEMEQLELDIERLEVEKKDIETALCSGSISVEQITELSKRLPLLNDELDEKSMRWLELSEI
ncbi:MAG: ABC-F family ATP-binding cassette domain-containing protein [Bacteroides sp.]|nr:ABC-F family ATP-binding cassette domain-containing protein [Roseburia sp.]MCM1346808.1 ABC-F family ATP-binding cassette domain-containing protein [Bacteroides sp.]MCM1421349.1 ABC-F family ATP-binding cassette domain-containing protein [Bacteroides sp.]